MIKHHISPNPHGCNQQLYSFLHGWYIALMSFMGSLHNNACLCLCQRPRPTFPYFGGAPCLSHAHGGIPCLSHAQGKDLSFLEFTFIIWKQEEHTGPIDVHKSINFPYFFFFHKNMYWFLCIILHIHTAPDILVCVQVTCISTNAINILKYHK